MSAIREETIIEYFDKEGILASPVYYKIPRHEMYLQFIPTDIRTEGDIVTQEYDIIFWVKAQEDLENYIIDCHFAISKINKEHRRVFEFSGIEKLPPQPNKIFSSKGKMTIKSFEEWEVI